MSPQTTEQHWRASLGHWIEHGWPHRFILTLIVVNAVTLGMETCDVVMERFGMLLRENARAAARNLEPRCEAGRTAAGRRVTKTG